MAPPLSELSPADETILSNYIDTVAFRRGSVICRAGDPADGCYIIDQGLVRIELEREGSDPDDRDGVLVTLRRTARRRATVLGITAWQVSISHSATTVVAVVLALPA